MGSPCEKRVRNNDEEVYLIYGEMQGVSKGNARFFYVSSSGFYWFYFIWRFVFVCMT